MSTDDTNVPTRIEIAKAKKYQRLLDWQARNPGQVLFNARKSYHTNHVYRNNRRMKHVYKRFLEGKAVGDQLVTELLAAGHSDVTYKKRWNE